MTHITAEQISRSLRPQKGNNNPHKPTRRKGAEPRTYIGVGTPTEFYQADKVKWQDFISAVASGNELATWVNSYNKSPQVPETFVGDQNGDNSKILEPLHVDVELRDREDEIRKGTIGKTMQKPSIENPGQTQVITTLL